MSLKVSFSGQRTGRPSKRLTLQLAGLKVVQAKIVHSHKNKTTEYQLTRINHLPTRQEVRLHSSQLQYPGQYHIELTCDGVSEEMIKNLKVTQLTSTEFVSS